MEEVELKDVVDWMSKASVYDIMTALEDADKYMDLEKEMLDCTSLIGTTMPRMMSAPGTVTYCTEPLMYRAIVVSVPKEARIPLMKLLRSANEWPLREVKKLINNPPFDLYKDEPVYDDPAEVSLPLQNYNEKAIGLYDEVRSLGVKVVVIHSELEDVGKWMVSLDKETQEEIIYHLDFFIKTFQNFFHR